MPDFRDNLIHLKDVITLNMHLPHRVSHSLLSLLFSTFYASDNYKLETFRKIMRKVCENFYEENDVPYEEQHLDTGVYRKRNLSQDLTGCF